MASFSIFGILKQWKFKTHTHSINYNFSQFQANIVSSQMWSEYNFYKEMSCLKNEIYFLFWKKVLKVYFKDTKSFKVWKTFFCFFFCNWIYSINETKWEKVFLWNFSQRYKFALQKCFRFLWWFCLTLIILLCH